MTIQQRSEELYPTDDDDIVSGFSEIMRIQYIKGAEEWLEKGKESMDFYVTERSRLIDDNNALIEEKEELAAKHDQEMKDFAEWVNDEVNPFILTESGKWLQACGNSTTFTTSELLELFRK